MNDIDIARSCVKENIVKVAEKLGINEDSLTLYGKYKDDIYISIMNQYTPVNITKYDNLNRKVTDSEYDELINYALDLGIKKAFMQEGETCKESFIPDFSNYENI